MCFVRNSAGEACTAAAVQTQNMNIVYYDEYNITSVRTSIILLLYRSTYCRQTAVNIQSTS